MSTPRRSFRLLIVRGIREAAGASGRLLLPCRRSLDPVSVELGESAYEQDAVMSECSTNVARRAFSLPIPGRTNLRWMTARQGRRGKVKHPAPDGSKCRWSPSAARSTAPRGLGSESQRPPLAWIFNRLEAVAAIPAWRARPSKTTCGSRRERFRIRGWSCLQIDPVVTCRG